MSEESDKKALRHGRRYSDKEKDMLTFGHEEKMNGSRLSKQIFY